jgi:hypothetical protein
VAVARVLARHEPTISPSSKRPSVMFVLPMSAASSLTRHILAAVSAISALPGRERGPVRWSGARLAADHPASTAQGLMADARAKLYINTGVVTNRSDIYNILRPLLKQTVTYTYLRENQVTSSGTGWVERIVVDHPEIASYFTPLSICLNLDSFDYLQFDTTSDQLLVYTLVIGSERVVLEFAAGGSRLDDSDEEAPAGRPLPRNAEELARDLRFIQMELMMAPESQDEDEDR